MGSNATRHLSPEAKKKSMGAMAAALAVGLVLLVALVGAVVGRYQYQTKPDSPVRAQEFYFVSDLLDGATHTLAPGSTEVSFTLSNHADDLRYSEMDITYAVTVEAADGTGAGSVVVDYGSDDKQLLQKNTKSDATVTIKGLQSGKTYTVTAVGKGRNADSVQGYEKTLTATIVVQAATGQLYQYQETSSGEYTLLTVWNEGDETGMVSISYTGIPDNTNPNMTDWETGGPDDKKVTKANINIGPHESKVFRFFEGADITVKDVDSKNVSGKEPQ